METEKILTRSHTTHSFTRKPENIFPHPALNNLPDATIQSNKPSVDNHTTESSSSYSQALHRTPLVALLATSAKISPSRIKNNSDPAKILDVLHPQDNLLDNYMGTDYTNLETRAT